MTALADRDIALGARWCRQLQPRAFFCLNTGVFELEFDRQKMIGTHDWHKSAALLLEILRARRRGQLPGADEI